MPEIVRVGVANARIKCVTPQTLEYTDEAGQAHIVNLEECARNWARRHNYQKSDFERPPGTTEEEVAVWVEKSAKWNSRCVGQRELGREPNWVELTNNERTRMEFNSSEEAYKYLLWPLMKFGWKTFDLT